MNRSTIERDHVIERFVLGRLPDDELDAFLAYQTLHPEIRAEVEAARVLVKSVRGPAARADPPRKTRIKRWLPWVFAGLALAILGGLFWGNSAENHAAAPPAPRVVPRTVPSVAPEPPAPGEPVPTAPPAKPHRLVAAQFRPNPRLEASLGVGQYRDNGDESLRWVQEPFRERAFVREKGAIHCSIEASVRAPASVAGQVQCLIFSNSAADYEAFRPLHTASFDVQEAGAGTFQLSFKAVLALKPGLYYYLIEDRESGSAYFIGKFTVR